MKALFLTSLLVASAPMSAECWRVRALKGYSAQANDEYALSADGISARTFEITIGKSGGQVVPASDMKCIPLTTTSLICTNTAGAGATVEIWQIDPERKRAIYTQNRVGFGLLDGAKVFVGSVAGECDPHR